MRSHDGDVVPEEKLFPIESVVKAVFSLVVNHGGGIPVPRLSEGGGW